MDRKDWPAHVRGRQAAGGSAGKQGRHEAARAAETAVPTRPREGTLRSDAAGARTDHKAHQIVAEDHGRHARLSGRRGMRAGWRGRGAGQAGWLAGAPRQQGLPAQGHAACSQTGWQSSAPRESPVSGSRRPAPTLRGPSSTQSRCGGAQPGGSMGGRRRSGHGAGAQAKRSKRVRTFCCAQSKRPEAAHATNRQTRTSTATAAPLGSVPSSRKDAASTTPVATCVTRVASSVRRSAV